MTCDIKVRGWAVIPYYYSDTSSETDSDTGSKKEEYRQIKSVYRGWHRAIVYKTCSDLDIPSVIPQRDSTAQKAAPKATCNNQKKFKGVKLTGGSGRLPDQVYLALRSGNWFNSTQ